MFRTTPKVAALLVGLVLAAAPAVSSARPDIPRPGSVATVVQPTTSSAPTAITAPATPVSAADEGFQWGDAAIGAAAILGLLGIAAGLTMLGLRYRHEHSQGLAH